MIGAWAWLMVAGTASAAPTAGCLIDHAHYRLRAEPATTLDFHVVPKTEDWWSELAGELKLGGNGRVSWWLPTASGSSGMRQFAWTATRDSAQAARNYPFKLRGLQYFAFDSKYNMVNATLHKGDVAPAHIFLTDMREAFYYQDDPATRVSPPQSLFDLVNCDLPPDRRNVIFPVVP